MSPETRAAFEDAAYPALKRLPGLTDDLDYGELFDALTAAGFSISLDSVRDHTRCVGRAACIDGTVCGHVIPCDHPRRVCSVRVPCGGSPVVWSAE